MSAAPAPTLLDFYNGWEEYHDGLVNAIRPLTPAQLDLRAAPHLWSIRTMLCHIVAVRAWWFHGWMGVGGAEFGPMMEFDEDAASTTRTAAEVVTGLDLSWQMVRAALQGWSAADLDAEFQRPIPNDAGERPRRTRGWIVYHVLEHDAHHGGEISLTLGMNGLSPIDL